MCKKLLLLFCALCLLAALPAETYTITEAELMQLENISENWEKNRQSLQSQVRNLKTELNEARNLSKTLNEQLQAERTTLNDLRQSYSAYEKEAARIQQALETERMLHKRTKTQRNKLLFILIGGAVLLVGFIVLKFAVRLKLF